MRKRMKNLRLGQKLMLIFGAAMLILLLVDLLVYSNMTRMMGNMDSVYEGNREISEIVDIIGEIRTDVYRYLNNRGTDELEDYYRSVSTLRGHMRGWNDRPSEDPGALEMKNIRAIADNYLKSTDGAINAKRGRNLKEYRAQYEESEKLYHLLTVSLDSMNMTSFVANSEHYQLVSDSQRQILWLGVTELLLVVVLNLLILVYTTDRFTEPLGRLADRAEQVGQGDLTLAPLVIESGDEVGIVSDAFNHMVDSLSQFIERLKWQMEEDSRLKQEQLLMESHLKDAQMGALQARINPHFLYNTINAGSQLAMLEDAEKTYIFLENVADFFRYNTRKIGKETALWEEISQLESYIYIMNTRYAGEIDYISDYEDPLPNVKIPSMVLQPLAENAIEHGIRGLEGYKRLTLSVKESEETILLEVSDNGVGMPKEKIDELLAVKEIITPTAGERGIGLVNVINRLRLYYGRNDCISIMSDGEGTIVRIQIPKGGTEHVSNSIGG